MKDFLKKFVPDPFLEKYREYKKRKELIAYSGDSVECSICKSTFKEFAPLGIVERKNARCLNCESLERHRLLWKYMATEKDLFNNNKKIKLLHFAPEPSFYNAFSRSQNIEYYPCDLYPELYKSYDQVKVKKADITNIPFEENYFDVILCNHVLEHIPDDKHAMSELYRVMKEKGWGIFQVPIDYNREITYEDFNIKTPEERLKAFGQSDHVRWYGKDYKNRLINAGFNVYEDEYVKSFSDDEIFRFGFIPTELIYYCEKKSGSQKESQ